MTTGPRVGLADVERIRSDTERFARMDQQHGGGHARWLVVSYLDHQVAPMLQGAYTEEVGRELFCAAAVLSRRAGVMALDAGRHGLAQCYYVQALRLAHAAGDRALGAYMLTQMAGQTIHLGHPVKAAELARAAQQGASDAATPTLLARIFAIEARAHARLGDRSACEKALSRSTAAFERAERSRDPRWLDGVNSGDVYLAWEFAKCFRDLHQGPRAVEWASMAVTGGDADQVRRRALSTALLASSYLEQNELERACATGLEAVALAERLKSHLSLDAIRELRGRFTPHVALGVV
ncbi:MAG: transcriptional regulator, partial [Actinomycetota bacterium]